METEYTLSYQQASNGEASRYSDTPCPSDKLEALRLQINDETYLYAAIQRLALVMSNELMQFNSEGVQYERKRRK